MGNDTDQLPVGSGVDNEAKPGLPKPTATFRRRAWRAFQRALDPLAPPRPLPMRRGRP